MDRKKSILLLAGAFLLCLLAVAAQAQNSAVIAVGSNSGYKQATVTVPVDFNPAVDKGVSAISFYLKYNPAELKFKEAKAGSAASTAGKSVSVNDKGDGIVRFVVFGLNNTVITRGVLAEVSFDILASASAGNTPLTLSNYSASTPAATVAPLAASNGSVAITDATVTTPSESKIEEKKVVSQESKRESIAQLPAPEPAVPLRQTIIVAPEYKVTVGQSMGQELIEPTGNNRDMLSPELTPQYEQPENRMIAPVEQGGDESAKYKVIEEKREAKQIKEEASLAQSGKTKEAEEKAEPKITIIVKPVKRLFIWRSYKLELGKESQIMPQSWELSKKQKLPYLLALDKKNGSIFGIIWGKGEFDLKLNIITKDKQFTAVPCKLKIE